MKLRSGVFSVVGVLWVVGGAFGQSQTAKAPVLAFEVASVRPASQADRDKVAEVRRSGGIPRVGPHMEGPRAEYNFMTLRALIANAYNVKSYQIDGPSWMGDQPYYIVANLPGEASKDDASRMLQALLEERFKLVVHRAMKEQAVLALVVGKGGPKLKESPAPVPLDENAPLKPHESMMDLEDGPARISPGAGGAGTSTLNMGTRGVFEQSVNMNTQTVRIEGKGITMAGFANMLTQLMQMSGPGPRMTVVDMTGIKGNYQASVDISLASLVPAGVSGPSEASEPDGGTTMFKSVEALGLKLEPRKVPVEQLVVDHAEKTPTEN